MLLTPPPLPTNHLCSTKSEGKIEQNKKQMQKHGEKVMQLQGEMQAKAKQAADEVISRSAQLEEPDS